MARWVLQKAKNMGCLEDVPEVLRVGSLCSGMGTDAIALAAVEKAWQTLGLRPDLKFKHEFFCEISTQKCDVLKESFPEVPHIFRDVGHMGRQTAMCYKCGEVHEVPSRLDVLIAGFSCKSVSSLNNAKKSITDRSGSTGETLSGLLKYAKEHKPRLMILENVMGIIHKQAGAENMMVILKRMLKARGYHGGYAAVNSRNYLLPQSRHRVWMWFVRTNDATFYPKAVATMKAFSQDKHFELEPLVNLKTTAKMASRCPASEKKIKYLETHDEFAKAHGLRELDSVHKRNEACQKNPQIARLALTQRMKHGLILKLAHLRKNGHDPDTAAWVLQLDQDVHRMPTQRKVTPCITPRGLYFITNQHKIMTGIDVACAQGLTPADLRRLKMHDVEDSLLRDCVGNAFSLPVAIISIVAAFQDLGSTSKEGDD